MSNDVYKEVTEHSYGSRIKDSIMGMLVGLFLVIAAAIFLFWNEGRTIKRLRVLEDGQSQLVQLQANQPINVQNDGKLVYINGMAMTMETQTDELFQISAKGISLARNVQMYQWTEQKETSTETTLGGKERTTTTYTYSKDWYSLPKDSSQFRKPEGHVNPKMPFKSQTFQATEVKVGDLLLSPGLISKIDSHKELPLPANITVPEQFRYKTVIKNNIIHIGSNQSEPQVGDIKIFYRYAEPTMVSVVAKQDHGKLDIHYMDEGKIEILKTGTHSVETLFKSEKKSNTLIGWGMRFGGWMAMFVGFSLIFAPLAVLGSIVPLLGRIIGTGAGFISFALASALSLIMIAIGWVAYRPIIGYTLVAIAVAFIILFVLKKGKHPQET